MKREKRLFKGEKNIPEKMLDQIIRTTPTESTYFFRIEVCKGLIFVFVPDLKNQNHPDSIDIFSPEGKYLYKAKIKFERDLSPIFSPFHNLIIKKNHLYVVFEDQEGEILISKYNISLP